MASEPATRLAGLATLLTALVFWALAGSRTLRNKGGSPESESSPAEATCPETASSLPPPATRSNEAGPSGIGLTAIDPGFTAREEEIMQLAINGYGNRQIAERLEIQEVTVRFHLRNIYKKTGLQNRKGLMALAGQLEWNRGSS